MKIEMKQFSHLFLVVKSVGYKGIVWGDKCYSGLFEWLAEKAEIEDQLFDIVGV